MGSTGPEGPKFCEILSHSVRYGMYDNNASEKMAYANRADSDQTAEGAFWSGSTLFVILLMF